MSENSTPSLEKMVKTENLFITARIFLLKNFFYPPPQKKILPTPLDRFIYFKKMVLKNLLDAWIKFQSI